MKKEKALNPRRKRYCLLRANGMTGVEAYKQAGYKESKSGPSELESMAEIKQEISRIQAKGEEKTLDLAKACQALSPKAIARLNELLLQKKAPQVAIRAIQEVFDRGFGKPRETIDTGVTVKWDIGIRKIENESQ